MMDYNQLQNLMQTTPDPHTPLEGIIAPKSLPTFTQVYSQIVTALITPPTNNGHYDYLWLPHGVMVKRLADGYRVENSTTARTVATPLEAAYACAVPLLGDGRGRVEVGGVYQLDALELLRALPDGSVDAVITDPPYGLASREGVALVFPHKRHTAVNETWDTVAPTVWMDECRRVLKRGGSVVCFGGRQSIYEFAAKGLSLGWRLINDITWEKPDAPPNFTGRMMTESTERALWFCPDGENWTYNRDVAKSLNGGINLRDVWRFNIERNERYHPTQKPLPLMQQLIAIMTAPDALIVDCFMGSGTTLVAAATLGRRFIGGDLSAEYCEIARQRVASIYGTRELATQTDMFAA